MTLNLETPVKGIDAQGEGRTFSPPDLSRFLARQPILDSRRNLIGYELLFRRGWENCFGGDSDEATRHILDDCLILGIEHLVDRRLAFVNCTREALVSKWMTLLPPETCVLEILETVTPDAELVEACNDLRRIGYRLALDDFVPSPEMQPLVNIASYVKVDFRLSDAEERQQIYRMMRGSKARLLAEKVEDLGDFNAGIAEGYDYFQGYFFAKPKVMGKREIPSSRINYLRLLTELSANPINLPKVVDILRTEPSLSFRLLRLANSPVWGIRRNFTSILDALMFVGEDRFRALASVATSCVLCEAQTSALVNLSLERGRFCELLAPYVNENSAEQFMLGMFSLLDVILEMPMESIMDSLALRPEAKAALLGSSNAAAVPLRLVRSFESGADEARSTALTDYGIDEQELVRLYLESVKWTSDLLKSSR